LDIAAGGDVCVAEMIGQETPVSTPIKYIDAERPPTPKELELWKKAQAVAKRVNLLSYMMKAQFKNILQIHNFAKNNKITLNEPGLPDLEKRMLTALAEIEFLKDKMCEVNQLELGVRVSSSGNDLDIVEPKETGQMGWILPAIIGAVIVIGIIARWIQLETEVSAVTRDYNGIMQRADMALCSDPKSSICQSWETDKQTGGYYKRESIIDSVKNAVSAVGGVAKKGIGAGIAIAIPLLIWLWAPRRKG
jgi:hypothetical protein